MNLFTQDSRDQGLVKRLKGLRFIGPDPTFMPARKGAVCQARYRLGAQPTVGLFPRVCQPMATAAPPRAFLCGLRLMAIDGTTEDVPDTPATVYVFGRLSITARECPVIVGDSAQRIAGNAAHSDRWRSCITGW